MKYWEISLMHWLVSPVIKHIVIGAGGLGFQSRIGQIGRGVANDTAKEHLH